MIIIKYLTKNILEKPFRTFLLVLCMGCCAFVALLSLDMMGSMDIVMKNMLTQLTGNSDILVSDSVGIKESISLSTDNDQLLLFEMEGSTVSFAEGEYTYYHGMPFYICNADYAMAKKMRLLMEEICLGEDEAVITSMFEKKNGYRTGDTITLYDDREQPHDYKIIKVLGAAGLANGKSGVFLSDAGYGKLTDNKRATVVYIDVLNDSEIGNAKEELEDVLYNAVIQVLLDAEDTKEMMQTMGTLFFLVFMICFFLVIFVSFSVSNRIVCERMAVVGTFRSLGLSAAFTIRLLFMENALYGLLGAALGVRLYSGVRQTVFNSLFTVSASTGIEVKVTLNSIPLSACFFVIFLAVIIMLACPLKEILRTAKTAIRDIIFDNKDTSYRMGKMSKFVGGICAGLAVITFLTGKNVVAWFVCFICLLMAVALLFPYVLKAAAYILQLLFEKWNMPVARMAALESYARKSTVGSAVLCATSATLAIIIIIFVSTLGGIYDIHPYRCDVHGVVSDRQEPAYFSYIKDLDGVKNVELLYSYATQVKVNDRERGVTVFGMEEGGFTLFDGIWDCPSRIGENSFVIDRGLAKKLGISVGDEVEFTFEADSYMPVTKTLTLQGVADAYGYDITGDVILVSKDMFIDMYHDRPGEVLVECENPGEVAKQLENYSGTMLETVETIEEYEEQWARKEKEMCGMLYGIIFFGIGLTVIGMVSNQLIGFEGRRRECAVLLATSMTREKLSRMLLLESMVAAGAALITAFPAAMLAIIPLGHILGELSTPVNVVYDVKLYLLFLTALWVVFTLVALFPIRKLRKLKLAAQLKYE